MACELLLLGKDLVGLPLLLVEEPEAHLHPQRQLRLMEFLTAAAETKIEGSHGVQVILTTHSPNLSSKIPLDNLVLIEKQRAFPLTKGATRLGEGDYRFLQRFLDSTRSNLFFARGLIIVEGDAEAILVPTVARLIDCDLTAPASRSSTSAARDCDGTHASCSAPRALRMRYQFRWHAWPIWT